MVGDEYYIERKKTKQFSSYAEQGSLEIDRGLVRDIYMGMFCKMLLGPSWILVLGFCF